MPYHVHIFLYRKRSDIYEYALFQRSDLPDIWQGIAGGGEEGESILQSAQRECAEEGGIINPNPLYYLDNVSCMKSTVFPTWVEVWGRDVLVLPMYFFAMPYDNDIILSEEHLDFMWLPFEQASKKVKMPDQNVALWELHERLLRGNLERPMKETFTKTMYLSDCEG